MHAERRRSRGLRILVICLVVAAGGFAAWRAGLLRPAERGTSQTSQRPGNAQAVPVQTATAIRARVPIYETGVGAIQAYSTVTIRSRVDGEIQSIAFREGQTVVAGDLLVQIDPRPFQAALDQAVAKKTQDEAQRANALLDLKRYADLAARDFASKQQVDTQHALVDQLAAQIVGDQAQIDNARTQLGYTTIRSPIAGRTGLRLVDQGNIVRASDLTGIVTIAQLHPIAALFTLPERDLPALQKALAAGPVPVTAFGQDGKDELARGTLALIDNQVDQTTGTIKLKAIFANENDRLWPGQFVNLRVLLATIDALTVPADAVQRTQQGLAIYVVGKEGTVDFRPVEIGPITQALAVVEHGLTEGEQVVTAGQYRLQPGAMVQVPGARSAATTTASGAGAGDKRGP